MGYYPDRFFARIALGFGFPHVLSPPPFIEFGGI